MKASRGLTVDQLRRMMHNPLDQTLLLEMSDRHPCKTAIDLQPLDEDALADEFEGRDLLDDTVEGDFVKRYSVLCLVLDLSLGPLLFLCGFATAGGGGCFCLGLGRK